MSLGLHIGTSGWVYDHWRGPFYPKDLPPSRMLAAYARTFGTVEVNNSFYRLPTPAVVDAWCRTVPPGFVFALKASRYLTHMKKLNEPAEALSRLLPVADRFGDRLGPILFQLPPRWGCNTERLAAFLELLPGHHRYAFEFRDPSWHVPAVYDLLQHHRVAFCISDMAGRQSPEVVTADFAYVRLHGPAGAYQGRYGTSGLIAWADRIRRWRSAGLAVFVYFDNDQAGYAPQDAQGLLELLDYNRSPQYLQ